MTTTIATARALAAREAAARRRLARAGAALSKSRTTGRYAVVDVRLDAVIGHELDLEGVEQLVADLTA
jgi:hypothetical protein